MLVLTLVPLAPYRTSRIHRLLRPEPFLNEVWVGVCGQRQSAGQHRRHTPWAGNIVVRRILGNPHLESSADG